MSINEDIWKELGANTAAPVAPPPAANPNDDAAPPAADQSQQTLTQQPPSTEAAPPSDPNQTQQQTQEGTDPPPAGDTEAGKVEGTPESPQGNQTAPPLFPEFDDLKIEEPVKPEAQQQASFPDLFSKFSEKYGQEVKSEADLYNYIDTLRSDKVQEVKIFPGLDAQTSQLVFDSIEEGTITADEVLGGNLLIDFHNEPEDARAHDFIYDLISKKNPGISPGELKEKIAERLDKATDTEIETWAFMYAESKNTQRTQLMSKIQQAHQERVAQIRLQETEAIKARQEHQIKVSSAVQKLDKMTGSNAQFTDDMKKVIQHALTNPDWLSKVIQGKSLDQAAQNVARLLFPQQMHEAYTKDAKNGAIQELLDERSNVPKAGQGNARPVSDANAGLSPMKQSIAQIDQILNS